MCTNCKYAGGMNSLTGVTQDFLDGGGACLHGGEGSRVCVCGGGVLPIPPSDDNSGIMSYRG